MIKVTEQDDRIILNTIYGGIALTKAQGKQLAAQLKKLCTTATKYGNKKVIAYGIEFDSKVESDFYEHLLQLHKLDEIIIQPKFVLQDKQDGMREISYIADFQVGALVFDVKGMVLPIFSVKKKMFKVRYPDLHLSVLNKCPLKYQSIFGKWVELDVLKKFRAKEKKKV